MGSVSHIEKEKKHVVKDVHRLARLGVRLKDFSNCCSMVHHKSGSSLVGDIKTEQQFDHSIMDFKIDSWKA